MANTNRLDKKGRRFFKKKKTHMHTKKMRTPKRYQLLHLKDGNLGRDAALHVFQL